MSGGPAPDDIVRTHAERSACGREPLLVLEPLREFLAREGLPAPADLTAAPIGEGHSNVTFVLSSGVVLRRPPRGPLPPSAHDVLREARLLSALQDTPVPTPRVLATCEDEHVIGAPFYVMELIEGEVVAGSIPPALDDPDQRAQIADRLIDALVGLHAVDWRAAGLEGFGRPAGYLERQLRRFAGLWQHHRTREIPEIDQVGRWLAEHIPGSPPAVIVHGDYRLGNVLFARDPPVRLSAVLDWEMATIGDPLADLGYLLTHWREPGDPPSRFNLQAVTARPGFPTRAELAARYESRSGRPVHHLGWYQTLALWKAAVFMEGNYRRALAGATDDPYLKSFGEGVVELAQRARRASEHALGA